MFEEDARAVAVRVEPEAHPRIGESTGRPREREPTGRFALQHLAVDDYSVETHFRVRRHLEGEAMPDAWRKVIREHPLGQRRAVGEGPPDLLLGLWDEQFSSDTFSHFSFRFVR